MSKELSLNRISKANDKSYQELLIELEEEKLYLTRLYQQGKNEHVQMRSNVFDINDEVQYTQNNIEHKEQMLKTLTNKGLKRGRF